MAENSGIEWTHHTFNPWIGCTKVSAACDNCYAERWDARFNGERWGPRAARTVTRPGNWHKPIKWNREAAKQGIRQRVFCASLADIFDNHKSIKPEWRDDLWSLIRSTKSLDWLLLTKRPQNIKRYLPNDWGPGYPNVWLGTTVENQPEADRRVPHILSVPAAIRFLSCEPLLGALNLRRVRPEPMPIDALTGSWGVSRNDDAHYKQEPRLHWIITGGESGPNHRHADPDWFRSLRDQCEAAGVPFLFKQWEGRTTSEIKALGRELDGVVHDGYPDHIFEATHEPVEDPS